MIPVEWPSMRSIARWVLPVLVGPRTAVTPTPRARASRFAAGENETGMDIPGKRSRRNLYHYATVAGAILRPGTSPERIAAESLTPDISEFVLRDIWRSPAAIPQHPVRLGQ